MRVRRGTRWDAENSDELVASLPISVYPSKRRFELLGMTLARGVEKVAPVLRGVSERREPLIHVGLKRGRRNEVLELLGIAGERLLSIWCCSRHPGTIRTVDPEPAISHKDVTTLMAMISDIQLDVAAILRLLSGDDGEEEEEDEIDLDA